MMQPLHTEHAASPARFAQGFWRTTLAALAVAGALGGCTSTAGSARSSDPAGQDAAAAGREVQGASGVTVFGDIDVGVTKERTR